MRVLGWLAALIRRGYADRAEGQMTFGALTGRVSAYLARATMNRNQLAYWALFVVTMAVYLAMVLWTLPTIAAGAKGLMPFDLRPGGYGLADAQDFITALSPKGLELYLGPQHWLDLAYPGLLALVLGIGLWVLLRDWHPVLQLIAVGLAGLGMLFDYLENARVGAMLQGGPAALTESIVAAASQATQLKSGFTGVAMVLILALLAARVWRRVRR
jgi:hypothetical protein